MSYHRINSSSTKREGNAEEEFLVTVKPLRDQDLYFRVSEVKSFFPRLVGIVAGKLEKMVAGVGI